MNCERSWEVMYVLCTALVSLYILFPALLTFLGVEQEIVLREAASLFSMLLDVRASHRDGISCPNATALQGEVTGV